MNGYDEILLEEQGVVVDNTSIEAPGLHVHAADVRSVEIVECRLEAGKWIFVFLISILGYATSYLCTGGRLSEYPMLSLFGMGIIVFSVICVLRRIDHADKPAMKLVLHLDKERPVLCRSRDLDFILRVEKAVNRAIGKG